MNAGKLSCSPMATGKKSDEVMLAVRVPRELMRRLQVVCAERRADAKPPHTQQAIVIKALETWLRRNE